MERVDVERGNVDTYDFGEDQFCLEPVFAPRPGAHDLDGVHDAGWLLTLVYDGQRKVTRLAILDAEHVADGPVAQLHVDRALPNRFHGTWWPAD